MPSAVLYAEIVPTTKGIQAKVVKEFSGGFDQVEKQGSGVFSRIAGFAKSAATAVTGAAAALAGISLKGGLTRLLDIENAEAKLKGLGNSTEAVTEIMNNALASVKGTAFTMGDAATVAASAVAAGIKPGQELTKYLKLTADAATIAGTSLGDMGGILNKVTAAGHVYNDSLQQLSDQGIPIYQWLADELHTSTDAVAKLASQGKISSEQFRKAIEDNISGAALSAGDTTTGAFLNLLASLGRIGAGLEGGVFPTFKDVFQGITNMLAPVEVKAKAIGDTFGAYVTPLLEKAHTAFDGIKTSLMGLGPIIAPLAGAFAALGAGGLGGIISKIPLLEGIGGPLSALAGPIGIVAAAIGGLVAASPGLRDVLGSALQQIGQALMGVFETLQPVFPVILGALVQLANVVAGTLGSAITALMPSISLLVDAFGQVLAQVLPALVPVIALIGQTFAQLVPDIEPIIETLVGALAPILIALAPVVTTLIKALLPLISAVLPLFSSILQAVAPLVTTLAQAIAPLITALLPPLQQIIGAITPIFATLAQVLTPIVQAILPIFSTLLNALLPVIAPLVQMFADLITPILGLISPLLQLVGTILTPLLQLLEPLIQAVLPILMQMFTALIPIVVGVGQALGDILGPAITAITKILGDVIQFITDVFQGKWSAAWQDIQNIGKDSLQGLMQFGTGIINGLVDLINGLTGSINNVTKDVGIPAIPKIPHIPVPHLAVGGTLTAAGTVLVGEMGPELLKLPRGAQVQPLDYAADVQAAGSRGGGVIVKQTIQTIDPMAASQLSVQQLAATLGGLR